MKLVRLLTALAVSALTAGPALAGDPHRRLVIGGECVDCDFSGSNLAGGHFVGGDFSGSDFSNSELLGARLVDMELDGADFSNASMIDIRLSGVSFDDADLSNAVLDGVRGQRVSLDGASLENASLDGGVFMTLEASGARFNGARFRNAVLRAAEFDGADLQNADFSGCHFTRASLDSADARYAVFSGAIFEHADLSNADLRGAVLNGARFVFVDLSGADLRTASGLNADMLRRACGDDATRLPQGLEITRCEEDEPRPAERAQPRTVGSVAARRAEVEAARQAIERALANLDDDNRFHEVWNEEALAAAREGLRAAAQEMEAEHAEALREIEREWRMEIRRAELGDTVRMIFEQADALERARHAGDAPRPPKAPQPPLPPRMENGLAGAPDGDPDADAEPDDG
ncbi:hypothetical protein DDZ18_06440 [Marinicauda salina]|uniref:Pentapeptide repeat-containing protein n=1 Tax=Marinicauda salina TaxID=2135793 RepID=A0A2U2BTI9_9PROT|nr:pentapeptide repeat-containing protein [Marinicauda salina]PWE17321.1 hypothetical protein DDZ18_06440 [Marinicauda salina]